MARLVFVFLTLAAVTVPLSTAADSLVWPQFRGPNAQGVSFSNAAFPVRFGPNNNQRWMTPIPAGVSSPIICGDIVVVTAFDDSQKQLQTIAINRRDGRIRWRRTVAPKQIERVHPVNSPAASTPATDGKRIISYFGSHGLVAYDLDGNELWQRPFPMISRGFGTGASPVIVGDMVVLAGHGRESRVLAIKADDGKTVWESARLPFPSDFPAPVQWNRQLVLPGTGGMQALSPADGTIAWTLPGLSLQAVPTPAIGDEFLFVTSYLVGGDSDHRLSLPDFKELLKKHDANGDGLLTAKEIPSGVVIFSRGAPGGVGDVTIHNLFGRFDTNRDGKVSQAEWEAMERSPFDNSILAIRPGGKGELAKESVAWQHQKGIPEVPSPLCYHGRVYLVKNGGLMACLDAKSGKLLFQERLGAGGQYYSSPVAADNKVYACSDSGTVSVVGVGPTLNVIARNVLAESIRATPALADGVIYIRTEKHLHAFGQP